jgi:hypothetical protein
MVSSDSRNALFKREASISAGYSADAIQFC